MDNALESLLKFGLLGPAPRVSDIVALGWGLAICIWGPLFSDLETAMTARSSALAWRTPGTGEPAGLRSMGSHRVGHNWATSLWLFTFTHWRRQWQPTPVLLSGEPQGRGSLGAWRLWGCTESDTTERLSRSYSPVIWSVLRLNAEIESRSVRVCERMGVTEGTSLLWNKTFLIWKYHWTRKCIGKYSLPYCIFLCKLLNIPFLQPPA